MDFRSAMEHYRAGSATEEERQLVEAELEKSQLLAEYLDAQWETPVPAAEAPRQELQKVRSALRRRNLLLVLTSLVLAAAILAGSVYWGIPALESRYPDPNTATWKTYTTDLTLALAAYSELFSLDKAVTSVHASKTGFAAYQVTVQFWDNGALNDVTYQPAVYEKGQLTLPTGFWDYIPANVIQRASYPYYYMDEAFQQRTRERLEKLPDYIQVRAAVSFPEDLDMAQLIAFQASLEDGHLTWVGIRNAEEDRQRYPLCGMKPFMGGMVWDAVNEAYPSFDVKHAEDDPEQLETHFKTLLQFSLDMYEAGLGLESPNSQEGLYYQEVLAYVEENGVRSYGGYLVASPQTFLKLLDQGVISQVWTENAWISF